MNDDRVYILDVYNRGIYPHDGYAKRKYLEYILRIGVALKHDGCFHDSMKIMLHVYLKPLIKTIG